MVRSKASANARVTSPLPAPASMTPCAPVDLHYLMEPAPGVPLLVGMVQEDLKGLLVGLALGIKDANAFLVRHAGSRWWRAPNPMNKPGHSTLSDRLGPSRCERKGVERRANGVWRGRKELMANGVWLMARVTIARPAGKARCGSIGCYFSRPSNPPNRNNRTNQANQMNQITAMRRNWFGAPAGT